LCESQQTQLKYLQWLEDIDVTFKDVAIVVYHVSSLVENKKGEMKMPTSTTQSEA